MKDNRNNRKKEMKKGLRLDEFLAEDRFDEEDEDSVTDDTLEFLQLDDETIETYGKKQQSAPLSSATSSSRYEEDEEYEDDEYEDEDEDYEDEEYEDEDAEYEDDEYEDEEYDYDDERGGVIVQFKRFLAEMSTMDMVVAMLGVVVVAGALLSGILYANAKSIEKQVASFASVGEEVEGISVIGEGGLLAVSESAKLSGMVEVEEKPEEVGEQEEEREQEQEKTIEVTLNLTSIQSDLKVKFVNKETGKLIGGVPFEVEVSGGKKTFDLRDEDKDGIIYQTNVEAGTYQVTAKPFKDDGYKKYQLPTSASSVKVTDTIAYKKVNVADEVKTEAEVNAAIEDTAKQNVEEESALQDTVEWVESTKTPLNSDANYEEIKKESIPDPATISALSAGFVKMVSEGTATPSEETPPECTCGSKCVPDVKVDENCLVCKAGNGENCKYTDPEPDESATKLATLALSKDSLTLEIGKTEALSVGGQYSTEASVSWSSENDSVASVSNGTVTAVGVGTTNITANVKVGTAEGTLKCTVTVTAPSYKITQISGSSNIKVGGTGTVSVTTDPADGTVSWTSSNTNIAKVENSNGTSVTVTGIAAGTVTITAKCGDAEATWQMTVEKDMSGDTKTKLKDKNGNQIYVNKDGQYKEATYADYYTAAKFYLQKSMYLYTGWQTIDGSVYFFDKNGNYVTGEQVIQGARYTFGSDGKLSSSSGIMGIDVSKWNGNIDWNAVKNSGVSYVIIRCGYRGSSTGALIEDPQFRSNIKGAKAAGLKVGVYFFSQAVNEVEAVEEASMVLGLVSGYGLNYPIFLDVEASGGRADGISKETRTAVCKAFCATIQNSGYSAGVYANKSWFTEKINTSSLTAYKIWLAQYASTPTYTATRYDMWQYSSKGKVSGISGNVDLNMSYMNY